VPVEVVDPRRGRVQHQVVGRAGAGRVPQAPQQPAQRGGQGMVPLGARSHVAVPEVGPVVLGQQQGLERDRRGPRADREQPAGPFDDPWAVALGGHRRARRAAVPGQPLQLGGNALRPAGGGEHLAVRVLQGGAGGPALVHDHHHRPERPAGVRRQPQPPGGHHPGDRRLRQVGEGGGVVGVVDDHLVDAGRRRRPVQPAVARGRRRPARTGEGGELVGNHPHPPAGPVRAGARLAVGPHLRWGQMLVPLAERAAERAADRTLVGQERLGAGRPAGGDGDPAAAERILAQLAGGVRRGRWRQGGDRVLAALPATWSGAHGPGAYNGPAGRDGGGCGGLPLDGRPDVPSRPPARGPASGSLRCRLRRS
jgi:hypothetical protein